MCRATAAFATPAFAAQQHGDDHIISANRYKTKFCRHYTEDPATGEYSCKCPYKKKCMFAHTPDELRTMEQNFQDNIHTKEDIRAWKKKVKAEAKALAEAEVAGVPALQTSAPSPTKRPSTPTSDTAYGYSSSGNSSPRRHSGQQHVVVPLESALHVRPYSPQEQAQGYYTHDPYQTTVVPAWEYNQNCACPQCSCWHRTGVYV